MLEVDNGSGGSATGSGGGITIGAGITGGGTLGLAAGFAATGFAAMVRETAGQEATGLATCGFAGVATVFLGIGFLGIAFVATVFLTTALDFGFALLGAAFTAFLATLRAATLRPALRALPVFLALAFTVAGRAFPFALVLWTLRLAFATGRFFDLLFFAMVTLLLEIVRLAARVALKKSAVICVRRWSHSHGLRRLPGCSRQNLYAQSKMSG